MSLFMAEDQITSLYLWGGISNRVIQSYSHMTQRINMKQCKRSHAAGAGT